MPTAGALEPSWPGGILCLGPKVTLKGFLFCCCLQKNNSLPYCSSFEERKKPLSFHFREFLSFLSLLPPPLLWFFCPLANIISSTFLPRRQLRGNVVLLYMDFRFIEGRGKCLPSQTGSIEPRLWDFRVLVSLQGWTLPGK